MATTKLSEVGASFTTADHSTPQFTPCQYPVTLGCGRSIRSHHGDGGFRSVLSALHLDSRLRGNDGLWGVQRGGAPAASYQHISSWLMVSGGARGLTRV